MRHGVVTTLWQGDAPELSRTSWVNVTVVTRPAYNQARVDFAINGVWYNVTTRLPPHAPRRVGVIHAGARAYFRGFTAVSAEPGLVIGGGMGWDDVGTRVRVAVVRRYNRALTSAEVGTNFRAQVARFRTAVSGSRPPAGNNGTAAPVAMTVPFATPNTTANATHNTDANTLLGRFLFGTVNASDGAAAEVPSAAHVLGVQLSASFEPALVEAVSLVLANTTGEPLVCCAHIPPPPSCSH